MKIAYSFLPDTGEYAGECLAQESPLEPGHFLLPAHATFSKPPKAGKDEVPVWDGSAWAIKPDFRGQSYWLADGLQEVMETIGDKPKGALDAPPPPSLEEVREQAYATIQSRHASSLNDLTGKATAEERDSWPIKADAARALLESRASDEQNLMLQREADLTGQDVMALAGTIALKSAAYHDLVGQAAGWKRLAEKKIEACTTTQALEATLENLSKQVEAARTEWKKAAQKGKG